ncbi:MAG: YihY/virulence factor BrkB family protein [Mycobacteriales bacterium]
MRIPRERFTAATAARRARERALTEQDRLREIRASVRQSVRPVVSHRPFRLLRHTLAEAWRDRVWGLSAEAAFWQLLSVPPLMLALLGSLGYLTPLFGKGTIRSMENSIVNWSGRTLSPSVQEDIVAPMVHRVLEGGRADIVSIGFVLALWAGSSATATYVNTISIAYGMRDVRSVARARLVALAIYLCYMLGAVTIIPVMVLGPSEIVHLLPGSLQHDARSFVDALYWPTVVLFLLAGLATLYYFAIPKRLPWHRGLPGAAFAGLIFIGGSYAIREYFAFVSGRTGAYGVLGAPIAALLYLFLLALAILLGAELNAELERIWPSQPSRRRRRRDTRAGHAPLGRDS